MSFYRFNILASTALFAVLLSDNPALSQSSALKETIQNSEHALSAEELAVLAQEAYEEVKAGTSRKVKKGTSAPLVHRGPSVSVIRQAESVKKVHTPIAGGSAEVEGVVQEGSASTGANNTNASNTETKNVTPAVETESQKGAISKLPEATDKSKYNYADYLIFDENFRRLYRSLGKKPPKTTETAIVINDMKLLQEKFQHVITPNWGGWTTYATNLRITEKMQAAGFHSLDEVRSYLLPTAQVVGGSGSSRGILVGDQASLTAEKLQALADAAHDEALAEAGLHGTLSDNKSEKSVSKDGHEDRVDAWDQWHAQEKSAQVVAEDVNKTGESAGSGTKINADGEKAESMGGDQASLTPEKLQALADAARDEALAEAGLHGTLSDNKSFHAVTSVYGDNHEAQEGSSSAADGQLVVYKPVEGGKLIPYNNDKADGQLGENHPSLTAENLQALPDESHDKALAEEDLHSALSDNGSFHSVTSVSEANHGAQPAEKVPAESMVGDHPSLTAENLQTHESQFEHDALSGGSTDNSDASSDYSKSGSEASEASSLGALGGHSPAVNQLAPEEEKKFREVRQMYGQKLQEINQLIKDGKNTTTLDLAKKIKDLHSFAENNQGKLSGVMPTGLQVIANTFTWSQDHSAKSIENDLTKASTDSGLLSVDHALAIAKEGKDTPALYVTHAKKVIEESKHNPAKYKEVIDAMDSGSSKYQQEVYRELLDYVGKTGAQIKEKQAGNVFDRKGEKALSAINGHLEKVRSKIVNKHFEENKHEVAGHQNAKFTPQVEKASPHEGAKKEAAQLVKTASKNTVGQPWRWTSTYENLSKDVFKNSKVSPLVKAEVAAMVQAGYASIDIPSQDGKYKAGALYNGSTRKSSSMLASDKHSDLLKSVGLEQGVDTKGSYKVSPAVINASNEGIKSHHVDLKNDQSAANQHEIASVAAVEAQYGHLQGAAEKIEAYHRLVGASDEHAETLKQHVDAHMVLAATKDVTHAELKASAEKIKQLGKEHGIPHAEVFAAQAEHHAAAKEQHIEAVHAHKEAGAKVQTHAGQHQDKELKLTHVPVVHTPVVHEVHQPVVHAPKS